MRCSARRNEMPFHFWICDRYLVTNQDGLLEWNHYIFGQMDFTALIRTFCHTLTLFTRFGCARIFWSFDLLSMETQIFCHIRLHGPSSLCHRNNTLSKAIFVLIACLLLFSFNCFNTRLVLVLLLFFSSCCSCVHSLHIFKFGFVYLQWWRCGVASRRFLTKSRNWEKL